MEQPNLKNIETFSVLSEVIAWYYYAKFWREKKFIKNKRKKKKVGSKWFIIVYRKAQEGAGLQTNATRLFQSYIRSRSLINYI